MDDGSDSDLHHNTAREVNLSPELSRHQSIIASDKNIEKEIADTQRLPSREFGRDLFSRGVGKKVQEDAALFNSSKALRARSYFNNLKATS